LEPLGKLSAAFAPGCALCLGPETMDHPDGSPDSHKIKTDKAPDLVAHSGALSAINGTYGFLEKRLKSEETPKISFIEPMSSWLLSKQAI
jgi:hypothetical protein